MFLMTNLNGVAELFPGDVQATRAFLVDRGIPAGSLDAVIHFSARLRSDPSFQRDVTSLVHTVIRRNAGAIDYADLLGILVVAAAEPALRVSSRSVDTSDAQEESVREILRFLTRIPRPTGHTAPVFVQSGDGVRDIFASGISDVAGPTAPSSSEQLLHTRMRFSVSSAEEESSPAQHRRAAIWVTLVVVLVTALASGWVLHRKRTVSSSDVAALQARNAPLNDEHQERTASSIHSSESIPVPRAPGPRKAPPTLRRTVSPRARNPIEAAVMSPELVPPKPKPTPPTVAETVPPIEPLSETRVVESRSESPASTPISVAPSVRRRLPKSVIINPGPVRHAYGGFGTSNANAPGVVHPASIGMMAANLISSPTPAYPTAASQARVEGQVTVRALIDRAGNVVDARVVSGPELLRAASLEAVQHWRYRPYIQGGKATEVDTTAILDFELP